MCIETDDVCQVGGPTGAGYQGGGPTHAGDSQQKMHTFWLGKCCSGSLLLPHRYNHANIANDCHVSIVVMTWKRDCGSGNSYSNVEMVTAMALY